MQAKEFRVLCKSERLEFSPLKIEAKKLGRVTLLFKLKLNEFHFCKLYCQVFIMDKEFQEKYNIKNPSLSGSRIVGEAFLKSLSTYTPFDDIRIMKC